MPSEVFRKPLKALCADGKVRTAHVKAYRYDGSLAADTWFSVPAYVKANGRTVAGYVSGCDEAPGMVFRALSLPQKPRRHCGARITGYGFSVANDFARAAIGE